MKKPLEQAVLGGFFQGIIHADDLVVRQGGFALAKHYPDSRPYPYDTEKPLWASFWVALAGITIAVILEALM